MCKTNLKTIEVFEWGYVVVYVVFKIFLKGVENFGNQTEWKTNKSFGNGIRILRNEEEIWNKLIFF